MQIVFDMAYDQGVAPLGVGVQGLIQLWGTDLGMTWRDIHHAMRIQGRSRDERAD